LHATPLLSTPPALLFQRAENFLQDTIEIVRYLAILNRITRNLCFSNSFVRSSSYFFCSSELLSVEFDDQLSLEATGIDDVIADRKLSAELMPEQSSVAKRIPELSFDVRGFAPKLPRACQRFAWRRTWTIDIRHREMAYCTTVLRPGERSSTLT